jgi:hypothetical protein
VVLIASGTRKGSLLFMTHSPLHHDTEPARLSLLSFLLHLHSLSFGISLYTLVLVRHTFTQTRQALLNLNCDVTSAALSPAVCTFHLALCVTCRPTVTQHDWLAPGERLIAWHSYDSALDEIHTRKTRKIAVPVCARLIRLIYIEKQILCVEQMG